MTDKQNRALTIARKCTAAGMTLAGAAGAIANFDAESLLSPVNVEDRYHADTGKSDEEYTRMVDSNPAYDFERDNGKAYGYGLAQWTFPTRKRAMRAFHRERGRSIGDFETQADFFLEECRTGFPGIWQLLRTSNDAQYCARQFCLVYENPANAEGQAAYRAGQAPGWYDFLKAHIDDGGTEPDEPEKDDEGIPIEKTWPPRTVDARCAGWPEVWLMQALLCCHGYSVLHNGMWPDDQTVKLKEFQTAKGLKADGVCGPVTWAKLLEQ